MRSTDVVAALPNLQLLTVAQVAEILQIDPSTARRLFLNVPGVLRIGTGSRKSIRIPLEVFQLVTDRATVKEVRPPMMTIKRQRRLRSILKPGL